MRFHLVHEVGNRQRWKTRQVISSASAQLLATDIAGLIGIQGVSVNPRTGSIIATFENVEGQRQLAVYLASLIHCPPIRREARSKYPIVPLQEPLTPGQLVHRLVPEKVRNAVELLNQNRMLQGVSRAFRSGANGMPILTMVVRPIISMFKGWGAPSVAVRQKANRGQLTTKALLTNDYVAQEATLDFGPLARHIGIAPFLPMGARAANALLGALPIIREGLSELFHGRLNVAVLDAAALIVSLLRRDFKTAGLLVLLLGMGEMLENYARKKSMASLAEQLSVKVDRVWVQFEDGTQIQKPFAEVTADDQILVRTGNVIPVDGVVVAGEAAVNQSTMTGEPLAVPRSAGGSVFAGTVVECGEILIRPLNIGDGTRLAKIIAFVEESEKLKAGIESRALRFADAIVPFNFALAGLVWFFTRDWTRTASVLLVDYSCALRLATPLAILSAMKEGTARGVVVKGGRYLEALAEVDTVVFDKTGTLTNATPALSDVVSLDANRDEDELLRLAACLEEHFPHPVSRAIVDAAENKGLAHFIEAHDAEVQYIVAHGICSSVDGSRVLLGSRHFIEDDEGIDCTEAKVHVDRLASEGKTVLYVALDGRLIGLLGIEDPIRPEAQQVIQALKGRGKRVIMLTGDDERTARAVAQKLDIDAYRAQVLPADKADVVMRLKDQGAKVLMVGDGINDSPALSAADVGVTLRDGTDIAQEVADVVLAPSLDNLLTALDLGEATLKRIRSNMYWSVGLNTGFLAGGLTGLITPAVSALMHNSTTIGVCLNAMRPQLGHYEGETKIIRDVEGDIEDILNRVKSILEGMQSDTARNAMQRQGRHALVQG